MRWNLEMWLSAARGTWDWDSSPSMRPLRTQVLVVRPHAPAWPMHVLRGPVLSMPSRVLTSHDSRVTPYVRCVTPCSRLLYITCLSLCDRACGNIVTQRPPDVMA
jgi:hypothetical protein